ncbi:hypothetical protein [Actinoplanes sp. NPDC051494]|uniref:hypothetical protein n=1 Tax=Actinoplanes sp. NPDC051494 TaxID=3363907 RepID=UPI0037B7C713
MHDSVYDIAGDDPRIAKYLRTSLTALANGSDPLLRELAEGVLSGQVNLRDAVASDVYDEAVGSAFERFSTHYDQLDADEKARLTSEAGQQLDELLDGHPSRA